MAPSPSGDRVWLILAHCFNMDGRAASQTITDKLPYLVQQGITPVIISAATGRHDPVYEHHQVTSPAPSGLRFEWRHIVRQKIASPGWQRVVKLLVTGSILPFYLLEKLFLRLDSQWSWFIPAYLRGKKLVQHYQPELIYATGGANSAFLAAHLLSRSSGIPWIAEVHDPMVHDGWQRNRQAQRWSAFLEGIICRHAQAAFWFTETALARAQERHPQLNGRGFVLLPGSLPPDWAGVVYRPREQLHFAHFGSLSPTRNLALFFQALAEVCNRRPEYAARVCVDIFGGFLDPLSREAMVRWGVAGLVREHGRLEFDPSSGKTGRQQVQEAMRIADVLLLMHGQDPFCAEYIPSKSYEYFWTGRPILAATWQNGQLDRLLVERGHWVTSSTDVVGLEQAILHMIERWENDGLPDLVDPAPISVEQAVAGLVTAVEARLRQEPS